MTPAQSRELWNARECADAGVTYYNVNAHKRQLMRRLVELGYLERVEGGYIITREGRKALLDSGWGPRIQQDVPGGFPI